MSRAHTRLLTCRTVRQPRLADLAPAVPVSAALVEPPQPTG
ncbi:hypothetical protein [Nocardioides sp. Root151]|nr:hypothetical protein [Nocardioides sp. Root151]